MYSCSPDMHGLACCHYGNILTLVYNNSSVYSPQHQSTIDTPLQPYTIVDNRINYYLPSVHVHNICMVQLRDNVALAHISLLSKLVQSIEQCAYKLLNSSV